MKSISAKVILWSVAALAASLAAFVLVSHAVVGKAVVEGMDRSNSLHFYQARTAYESGGPVALSRFLDELNRFTGAEQHLMDRQGKDLASGENRSEVLREAVRDKWTWRRGDETIFGQTSGNYAWVVVAKSPFSTTIFVPFYLLVLATVGGLYWLVTAQIASPLRRLAAVVDRFGGGEFDARAKVTSKDEIGNLGRSFNAMADRFQSLLAAERQLLQDVSHELRSPLARLTFEAEMVRKTADQEASAARLRHEIERLSELVGTLLEMARAEGDPSAVEMEALCLTTLLQGIVDDCTVEASAKGCTLSLASTGNIEMRGNAELLHRAFENVVRNGIRYSPSEAVVEIDLRRTGDNVVASIRDRGPGVPQELIDRIFDPFFRVDPARGESTGGLGLGLAIARRAVRAHQGEITAENVHPGALLKITIPIRMALHSRVD